MRRFLAGAAVALFAPLGASCSALPGMPDSMPTQPTVTARPTASEMPTAGDGFDPTQQMAVRIRNVGCGTLSTGSGFALDKHTLVTNKHVVKDARSIQLLTYDGHDVTAEATSTAALADIAIIRTAEELPAGPELASADPKIGDLVTVIGYPEGGRLTVTKGKVVQRTTDPLHANLGKVLVTDAKVQPGSSGSAALGADGRVIGVVYAKAESGVSLLVPVSTLREMLSDQSNFAPLSACES